MKCVQPCNTNYFTACAWNATKQLYSAVKHKLAWHCKQWTLLLAEQPGLRHHDVKLAVVICLWCSSVFFHENFINREFLRRLSHLILLYCTCTEKLFFQPAHAEAAQLWSICECKSQPLNETFWIKVAVSYQNTMTMLAGCCFLVVLVAPSIVRYRTCVCRFHHWLLRFCICYTSTSFTTEEQVHMLCNNIPSYDHWPCGPDWGVGTDHEGFFQSCS